VAPKRMRILLTILFVGYSFLLIYWMFLGFGRTQTPAMEWRYNLIPLKTIKSYIFDYHHYSFRTWAVNLFGNIAVFVPFGVFLPAISRAANRLSRFVVMFFIPLLVLEILQTVLRLGSFDVDDLILNLLGALLGYTLYRYLLKLLAGGNASGRPKEF
jgi:glycopeptide antibiotics resistance protein